LHSLYRSATISPVASTVLFVSDDEVVDLSTGERLLVGRGPDVDLVLTSDPRVHRRLAVITHELGGWSIVNVGRWLLVELRDLDGAGLDQVRPGDRAACAWARTRVGVTLADATSVSFEVSWSPAGLEPDPADKFDLGVMRGQDTQGVELVPGSGHFRALVALVEPRLVDPSSHVVPTNAQICARLNAAGVEAGRVSAKTVERRLDYCRIRLGLKLDGTRYADPALDVRRTLANVALASGAVTMSHLSVLAPPRPAG